MAFRGRHLPGTNGRRGVSIARWSERWVSLGGELGSLCGFMGIGAQLACLLSRKAVYTCRAG